MLPKGTEPLILADGTKIDPVDGAIVNEDVLVPVPNTEELKREVVAARKRISDLPVPPNKMNTLSVIIAYSIFGISDEDISLTLSIPLEQLKTIKISSVYTTLQKQLIDNILQSDASDVRGLFIQESRTAAQTMFTLMRSENETTRSVAAKDVLDRAGQRPVDVIEHLHKVEGGLVIEYVERKENIPMVDVTPEKW